MNETTLTAFANLLVIHDCNQFHRRVMYQCRLHKIKETFRDFLYHKRNNDYVGIAYSHLYTAPLMYLANSIAFHEYYYTLDADFKYDLIDENDLHQAEQLLQHNTDLQQQLFELMGSDAKYVYTNKG